MENIKIYMGLVRVAELDCSTQDLWLDLDLWSDDSDLRIDYSGIKESERRTQTDLPTETVLFDCAVSGL